MKTRARNPKYRSINPKHRPRAIKHFEVDWQHVRQLYETGHNPEIIAKQLGINIGDIYETAIDENWNLPVFSIDSEGRYVYNQ